MSKSMERAYPSLKAWRKAKRLTQIDAAKHLQMTQSHYSRLERGKVPAGGQMAVRVMERTGVPIEVLLGAA